MDEPNRTEPERLRYPQVFKYVTETPWAIWRPALVQICQVLAFKAAGGSLSAEELETRIGAAKARAKAPSTGAIAVLPIQGVIVPHADLFTEMSGGTSIDGFLAQLREAMADDSVSTIVLNIDSPGGSVELLAEAAAEIREARKSKDVVAVANAFAASAAYYLMSQASQAIATPSGQVGSIGTIAIHQDLSKALEMEGIDPTIVTYGEHKADQHPFKPLSEDGLADIQAMVDSYGREFVADVAKGRGVSTSRVENEFGQGLMFRPEDAFARGMIDGIASFDAVISNLLAGRPATGRARAELASLPAATAARRIGVEIVGNATGLTGTHNTITTPAVAVGAGTGGATPSSTGASARVITPADEGKEGSTMEPNTTQAPRTREEIVARMDEIRARQEELDRQYAGALMEGEDEAEFEVLDAEYHELEKTIAQMERRARSIERKANGTGAVSGDGAAAASAPFRTNADTRKSIPENVFDLVAYRGFASSLDELKGLWVEGAKRVDEGLVYETDSPDKVRNHVARLLEAERGSSETIKPSESFAHRMLVTGNPAYDRAFGKLVLGRPLNEGERRLVEAAVSHTGLGSETPVPVTIDPTVLLTSDGQVNPLRQIARTVTITGNKWRGISSDGATVAYEAELTQVGDQTPTIDAPEATVQKAHGYVEFSIEVDQDWPAFRSELAMMFADAKDAKEAEKFLFGTGTNEPEGLLAASPVGLVGSASEIETATAATFALGDLYALKAALPARWRARAAWLANDGIFGEVRQFGDDSNNTFWTDLSGDTPALLLGKPVYEASEMSADLTIADNPLVVYGDFSRGFVIVDRVGMNVELIPHVLGANRRPIGARALYVYFRNTSKVLTVKAFRLLSLQAS